MNGKSESKVTPLIISQERKIERDNYYKTRAKKSRWFQASPEARMVVDHMRRVTPPGAALPWRSGPSVEAVDPLLDDGAELQELLDHVTTCAELVKRGKVSPRWWYPSHLFGSKTMGRWSADGAVLRSEVEAAEANQRHVQALRERSEAPRAPRGPVVDLALRGLEKDLTEMYERGTQSTRQLDAAEERSS